MINSPSTRANNFDAIRLIAAFFVLISHQYALNGQAEPRVFGSVTLGAFGVMVFFSISGFLVSQSWRQDPHPGRFLAKRFLRIWPGLAAFTLLAAFVLGPLVSTLNFQDYVKAPEFVEFFGNLKLVSIRYFLPGVFESNTFPKAINGSLWTIPIEVRCYLALLLLGSIGLARKPNLTTIGLIAFGTYYFAFSPDPTHYQFHFGLFFFAGAWLDLFRKEWESRATSVFAMICLLASGIYFAGAPRVALLVWIVSASVFAGSRSTPFVNRFGRFGDISYGIYVYAFAVQQTVLWLVGKQYPFMAGLWLAAVATTVCALLSWHLIEGPALRLKVYLQPAR
jgi:peptidoglycan/LPS O-acetylase OafA/YrhL